MRLTARLLIRLLGAAVVLAPVSGYGQSTASHAPPNTEHVKRIQGTVARFDGTGLMLKVSGGTTESYQLSPAVQIARSRPGQMADLKSGAFVGCINLYGQSTRKVAGECSILPDALRRLVENRDDAPSAESAWVAGIITGVRDDTDAQGKGQRIWIQISANHQVTAMAITPVTRVTLLTVGDASALKPGVQVRGVSQQAVDGTGIIQSLTAMTDDRSNSP